MAYDSDTRGDRGYGRTYGWGDDGGRGPGGDGSAGRYGGDDHRGYGSRDYGSRDYGYGRYDQRDRFAQDRDQAPRGGWDRERPEGGRDYYGGDRGSAPQGRDQGRYGADAQRRPDRDRSHDRGGYGRQPQGYQYEDRGFLARAGDEVRSWFGDDEAERRRDQDARLDERYANDRDDDYHSWRRGQIDALDRDYHEYRQENRSKFETEFSTWRTARQGQRDQLGSVAEHQEVVGSDGAHVGTVDKVRGDRIILTKTDQDAGGHHHSIPSRWIDKVADKVTLSKTAAEAKQAWRDEENRQAMSGWGDRDRDGGDRDRVDRDRGRTNLSRSFSGTY